MQGSGGETCFKETLENLGIDGIIILKLISKQQVGGLGWIGLAENGHKWQAHVNAVMNISFHKMWVFFCLAEELLASRERLCCMDLVSWSFIRSSSACTLVSVHATKQTPLKFLS